MLSKEEAKTLMETKGEVRGTTIKADWDFVMQKKGRKAVEEIEKKMAKLGYPLKYKEIRPMDYYPIGLNAISVFIIKEILDLKDKDIEEWGASIVKFNLVTRVFMKYFVSLEMIVKQVPNVWRQHSLVGDLEVAEFSKEKRYLILRMKKFKIDPAYCLIHKGFFRKVAEMVLKAPVKCEEIKCVFRGDECHEYLLTWQQKK